MAEENSSDSTKNDSESQILEDKKDEEFEHRKDSILNDPAATHQDILRRYQAVQRNNDERIKNLLRMQNKPPEINLRKAQTNWPGSRKLGSDSAQEEKEEEWKIIPSSLTLHPPYSLMDTVDLEASFTDEKAFKTSVKLSPEDWIISVLPENGTLSSDKNVGLLIKCDTKHSEFPKNKTQQNGIIEVYLDNEVKELVILINYIPISFGTWIVCKDHPGRRPSPTQISQLQEKQQQEQQQKQTSIREKNQNKSKTNNGFFNNQLPMGELQAPSANDFWRQLKGITLTNRKAIENLSIKHTRKNVFHRIKEKTHTTISEHNSTTATKYYPSIVYN